MSTPSGPEPAAPAPPSSQPQAPAAPRRRRQREVTLTRPQWDALLAALCLAEVSWSPEEGDDGGRRRYAVLSRAIDKLRPLVR